MDPAVVNAAAEQLSAAVQNDAVATGDQVSTALDAKAAGLNTGQFDQGGYTYNRVVQPVVAPLQAALVTSAKQALFRQAVKEAQNSAQTNYDNAKYASEDRLREAQRRAKAEAERKYAASIAAASGTSSGAGSTGTISGVNVAGNDKNYIGNNDVRGRLTYLAKQGDKNAATALKYVGNDNKYYLDPGSAAYKAASSALAAVGATNVYKAPAPAPKKNTAGPFGIISILPNRF